MTYFELLSKANRLLDKGEITIGQRDEMTKPLWDEIRPKGEWIKWNFRTFGPLGDWEYKCSNCEKVFGGEYNFCPNCGADMKKTEGKT